MNTNVKTLETLHLVFGEYHTHHYYIVHEYTIQQRTQGYREMGVISSVLSPFFLLNGLARYITILLQKHPSLSSDDYMNMACNNVNK